MSSIIIPVVKCKQSSNLTKLTLAESVE